MDLTDREREVIREALDRFTRIDVREWSRRDNDRQALLNRQEIARDLWHRLGSVFA